MDSAKVTVEHEPTYIQHSPSIPADTRYLHRSKLDSVCRNHLLRLLIFFQTFLRADQSRLDNLLKLLRRIWLKVDPNHA
jgi:hypothetical protein